MFYKKVNRPWKEVKEKLSTKYIFIAMAYKNPMNI